MTEHLGPREAAASRRQGPPGRLEPPAPQHLPQQELGREPQEQVPALEQEQQLGERQQQLDQLAWP